MGRNLNLYQKRLSNRFSCQADSRRQISQDIPQANPEGIEGIITPPMARFTPAPRPRRRSRSPQVNSPTSDLPCNTMRRRSPLLLFLLLLGWSLILGWGLAQSLSAQTIPAQPPLESSPIPQIAPDAPVDVVSDRYQLGQQLYLEACASCHVGLPPQVMPSQTWAALLQDSQHYGVQITPLVTPPLQIAWDYVSHYSRPILERERTPYRLTQSRYFKALHPKVEFTEPIGVGSCATCHPAAAQFNYRRLAPEWEDAP